MKKQKISIRNQIHHQPPLFSQHCQVVLYPTKKKNITISINIPLNPMFYGHPEVSTPGSLHIQQHMHLEAPVTGFHHEDLAAVAWETRPEDS